MASKSPKKLEALSSAHQKNYFELGDLLGYPKCCVDTYEGWLRGDGKKFIKSSRAGDFFITYFLSTIEELRPYPFVNNVVLSYFDLTILSHIPCSPACEESKRLGREYLKLMSKADLPWSEKLRKTLKSWILFTKNSGFVIFPDAHLKDFVLNYRTMWGNAKKPLQRRLEGGTLEVISFNQVLIRGRKLSNSHALLYYQ